MRYADLVEKSSPLSGVLSASRKRADAAASFQQAMRSIPKSGPADTVPERQAKARKQYQDRSRAAGDALRAALERSSEPEAEFD